MTATTLTQQSEGVVLEVVPYLFARREYITAEDASTTACKTTTTSPVAEYTPDD